MCEPADFPERHFIFYYFAEYSVMNKIFQLLIFLSFSQNISGQAPCLYWNVCYGGSGFDIAYDIIESSDSCYLFCGVTTSSDGDIIGNHGGGDAWLVKVTNTGSIIWAKCFGSPGGEQFKSITETPDHCYLAVGFTMSNGGDVTGFHGDHDYWVVKIDSNGNLLWQKCLGGTDWDVAYSVISTVDSCFVIGGTTLSTDGDVTTNHGSHDFWIIKIDSVGGILWEKCFGGSYEDDCFSVYQTLDKGFAAVGSSRSDDGDVTSNIGGYDYWFVKVDSIGILEYQASYGGTDADVANGVIETDDSSFIIIGETTSNDGHISGNHGYGDTWLIKSNLQQQKCFGGSGPERGTAIKNDLLGGYFFSSDAGSTDGDVIDNRGAFDYWLVKCDSAFNIQWSRSLGGSQSEQYSHAIQTSDSGYIVSGESESTDKDVWGTTHGNYDVWIARLKYLKVDVGVNEIVSPTANGECDTSLTPSIKLLNGGSVPLNSVEINFRIDSGNFQVYNWNGNLLQDSIEIVFLPMINVASGSHTIEIQLQNPNGTTDEFPRNDTLSKTFVIDNIMSVPLIEGFETGGFPPIDWSISDPNFQFSNYSGIGGFGNSAKCLKVGFFNSFGQSDLITPNVDLTNLINPITLNFSIASSMINNNSQQSLAIYAFTDCGLNWTQIYLKQDTALSTSVFHPGNFVPQPNEWRKESIDITSFAGQPHVLFVFDFQGTNTNNSFLDDINLVDAISGLQSPDKMQVSELNCSFIQDYSALGVNLISGKTQQLTIRLTDYIGRSIMVKTFNASKGSNHFIVNLPFLSNGLYLLQVDDETNIYTRKVVKN